MSSGSFDAGFRLAPRVMVLSIGIEILQLLVAEMLPLKKLSF